MKTLLRAVSVTAILLVLGQAPTLAVGKAAVPKGKFVEKEADPAGIGSLKLGMSKAEVEALTFGDLYIASRFLPTCGKKSKNIPGAERYVSKLVTPFSPSPMDLSLVFKDGALISISVFSRRQSSVVTTLAAQVMSKFGEGVFSDSTYEIPCGFQNGEKLLAKNGDVTQVWTNKGTNHTTIQTTFTRARLDSCNARRQGDELIGVTLEHLTVELLQSAKPVTGDRKLIAAR